MLWLFPLWYCVDDTLAEHFSNPQIGTIDWWVVLILSAAFYSYNK